jgi:hypothetical protein
LRDMPVACKELRMPRKRLKSDKPHGARRNRHGDAAFSFS